MVFLWIFLDPLDPSEFCCILHLLGSPWILMYPLRFNLMREEVGRPTICPCGSMGMRMGHLKLLGSCVAHEVLKVLGVGWATHGAP